MKLKIYSSKSKVAVPYVFTISIRLFFLWRHFKIKLQSNSTTLTSHLLALMYCTSTVRHFSSGRLTLNSRMHIMSGNTMCITVLLYTILNRFLLNVHIYLLAKLYIAFLHQFLIHHSKNINFLTHFRLTRPSDEHVPSVLSYSEAKVNFIIFLQLFK